MVIWTGKVDTLPQKKKIVSTALLWQLNVVTSCSHFSQFAVIMQKICANCAIHSTKPVNCSVQANVNKLA